MKLRTLMIGLALIGLLATGISIPLYRHLHAKQRQKNEGAVIGALKAIASAQSVYREGDKDGDGVLAYAPDLASLVRAGVLQSEIGDGEYHGYRIKLRRHKLQQFVWSVTAEPLTPGRTGDLFLGMSMRGVVHASRSEALVFGEDGAPPPKALTIGARPSGSKSIRGKSRAAR